MTNEEIIRAAFMISQLAKEIQNSEARWSTEHWRKISRAIEKIEESARRIRDKSVEETVQRLREEAMQRLIDEKLK